MSALFTELPRSGLLGNSEDFKARKAPGLENPGEKDRGAENPGGKSGWAMLRRG